VRVFGYLLDGRLVLGDIVVFGILVFERGTDAAARKTELRRIRACVFGDLRACVCIQRRAVLGFASVRRILRIASACQRVAVENENKLLGGLRDQSILV